MLVYFIYKICNLLLQLIPDWESMAGDEKIGAPNFFFQINSIVEDEIEYKFPSCAPK